MAQNMDLNMGIKRVGGFKVEPGRGIVCVKVEPRSGIKNVSSKAKRSAGDGNVAIARRRECKTVAISSGASSHTTSAIESSEASSETPSVGWV
jgi:hypothetical protein